MSEIVGYDMTPDAGTTLRKMLKLNLYPFLAQFEEVSAGATKVTVTTLFWVYESCVIRQTCSSGYAYPLTENDIQFYSHCCAEAVLF